MKPRHHFVRTAQPQTFNPDWSDYLSFQIESIEEFTEGHLPGSGGLSVQRDYESLKSRYNDPNYKPYWS